MATRHLKQKGLKNKESLGMACLLELLGLPVGRPPAAAEGAAFIDPSAAGAAAPPGPSAWADLDARPVTAADQAFLRELYASTRTDEMQAIGWPAPRVRSFLDQQFDFQQRRQRALHPRALFLLLQARRQPVGCLAWLPGSETTPATLIDLVLVPAARGQGLGQVLLALLTAAADQAGWPIELQIDRSSRALPLLQRHGFLAEGDDSLNLRLRRPASASASAPASASSSASAPCAGCAR